MKFVVQGWEAYVSNKKDSALPENAHGKTRQVNIMNEALGQLNAMTALFRLHVRERDMDPEEIATLIHAEEFSREMQQSVPTMHKGNVVMVDGQQITEPNNVTKFLKIATLIGMEIQVQDPDQLNRNGDFGYHDWTKSWQTAWKQIIDMHMAVDEDFLVRFKNAEEQPVDNHVHWIQMVTGGGNTPNDGWLCDSCTCDIMETLWK